jgi:hypothetical protein
MLKGAFNIHRLCGGAGNPLGTVAGLLDNAMGLAKLLNEILAIL